MKIDADEKELLESVERGEWTSAAGVSAGGLVTLGQQPHVSQGHQFAVLEAALDPQALRV